MDKYYMSSNDESASSINVASQKDYMFGEDTHSIKGGIYEAFEGRSGKQADVIFDRLKKFHLVEGT